MLRSPLNKKADLTFTQIVIAVISLVVLVILIVIFSGSMGGQSKTVNSCAIKLNGVCSNSRADCNGVFFNQSYSDCVENQGCCVNPMASKEKTS